jgi:protein-disulfide isomerase
MNDLLFHMKDKKYVRVRKLSEQLGLDYHALSVVSGIPEFRYALKHDIAVGIKLGITGTPAFVIDGKVYQGQIPPSIIQRVAN